MVRTADGPVARSFVTVVVLVVVLAVAFARPARAQVLEAAVLVPPALAVTATTGTGSAVLGLSGMTATGGTAAAAGTVTGIAAAPVVVTGAAVLGGLALLYVGYRYFAGDGLPWEWADGVDPAFAEAPPPAIVGEDLGLVWGHRPSGAGSTHTYLGWRTWPCDLAAFAACAPSSTALYTVWTETFSDGSMATRRIATTNKPTKDGPTNAHLVFVNDGAPLPAPSSEVQACYLAGATGIWSTSTRGVDCTAWKERNASVVVVTRDPSLLAPSTEGQWTDPEALGRIVTRGECTHKGTGAKRTVTATSPSYAPTAPLPLIPGVECSPDERLTDLEVERQVPGTSVPPVPILGDFTSPSLPDHMTYSNLLDELEAECEARLFEEQAIRAYDGEPPMTDEEMEAFMEECLERGAEAMGHCLADVLDGIEEFGRFTAEVESWLLDKHGLVYDKPSLDELRSPGECEVEVYRKEDAPQPGPNPKKGPSLKRPPLGPMWWYDPDRKTKYRCVWGKKSTGYVPLALPQCEGLVTEDHRQQKGGLLLLWPNQGLWHFPLLPPPTPTGDPPTAPTPDAQCMDRARKEEEGFFSFYVFKGVSCALVWAFVPSQGTQDALTNLRESARTRAPFSLVTGVSDWLSGFTAGDSTCWVIASEPHPSTGQLTVMDTCRNSGVEGWLHARRPLMRVVVYAMFVVPLLGWAWRQYAPGSQGMA
jgi:hypothetical protein